MNKNIPQKSIKELTDKRNIDIHKFNKFGEITNAYEL